MPNGLDKEMTIQIMEGQGRQRHREEKSAGV